MNDRARSALNLADRVMITIIFVLSALGNKIPNFNVVAGYMASEGVPLSKLMLGGAIAFLLVGSASVITGYKVRWGASLLLYSLLWRRISSTTFGPWKARPARHK